MHKETIIEYKKEFDEWLNGRPILYRSKEQSQKKDGYIWLKLKNEINGPSFCNEFIYICDDSNVEILKAYYDGLQLERMHYKGSNVFEDWNYKKYDKRTPLTCPNDFRIKKNYFKKGDWVYLYGEKNNEHIAIVNDKRYFNRTSPFAQYSKAIAWEPEINEFCIMWNDNQDSYRISKFKMIAHGSGRKGQYKDAQSNYFTHIAPLKYAEVLERKNNDKA